MATTIWERSPRECSPALGPWIVGTLALIVFGSRVVVAVVTSDALFLKAGNEVPKGSGLIDVSD